MPRYANAEIMDSLQRLLRQHAISETAGSELILTTAPQEWVEADLNGSTVVNISDAIGCNAPWVGGSRRDSELRLETAIHQQLIDSGWPPENLRQDVQISTRSARRFDIGVIDAEQNLVGAIELVDRYHKLHSASGVARQMLGQSDLRFACVSDGSRFILFTREGEAKELGRPPIPDDFGLALAFHAAPKQELKARRPSTIGALLELVANHLPKRFILDYTIPWGGRVPPEDPMRSLLPQDISRELRGITDTSHLLLMWAASQPSVDSIAAIIVNLKHVSDIEYALPLVRQSLKLASS